MSTKLRSETSIKTERLWLRQIDETDAESIVALRSDENVYKYFLNPVKLMIEEHRKWYEEQYIDDYSRVDWIAVDDETGAFIGVYGAKKVDEDTVEVSYITSSSHQHRGYAREAVAAIINWCKDKLKVVDFVVNVHENNEGSLKFAQSMGFILRDNTGCFTKLHLKHECDTMPGCRGMV